jgi:hypothetical protein
MKVVQRFSAGWRPPTRPEPAKRATEFPLKTSISKLCRPFHGLSILSRSDPSAEALGYFHTRPLSRTTATYNFLAKPKKESDPKIRAADKKAMGIDLLQLERVNEATAQSFAARACQSQHHKKLLRFANFASQDPRRATECW